MKFLRHPQFAQHFVQAAMLNGSLEHPHIPALYEIGRHAGRPYSVRMFVRGDDVQNGLRGKPRSLPEVARIVADVASALDYAHGRGVIHGCVHPRHVLVDENGSAWLIGFGEYPPADAKALGNPLHLAPEQMEGDNLVTPASDVFALAETALWLLCGRHPFEGMRDIELLAAKLTPQLRRPIQDLLPGVSPAVEQVLQRGLAAEPEGRYTTAGEFATALAAAGHAREPSRRWSLWR
jgi:serine/threonine-protein kinase